MGTANQTKQPHTPGPWETREVAHEATPFRKRRVYRLEITAPQYLYGKRTHSRDICQMVDYCEWTDHPANARLIAAAPELLAALRKMTAWIYGCVVAFEPMAAALHRRYTADPESLKPWPLEVEL